MRGVDVSVFNEGVNWAALKAAGVDFAICRTGYGKSGVDESFQAHVGGAHAAGIICGAYHYSYALTPSDAAQEAVFCKELIEKAGVLLELPVWFAMSDSDEYKKRHGFDFSRRNVTAICKTFLENIKPLNCGVFASLSWLEDYIDWQTLGCDIWSAQWSKEDAFKGRMWQYTDALTVGGQNFNGNILYEKNAQTTVQGAAAPVAGTPTQQATSTQNLIHNILANAQGSQAQANTATPATPKPSAKPPTSSTSGQIQNILLNLKPQGSATKNTGTSTDDLIHNVLANVGKKK